MSDDKEMEELKKVFENHASGMGLSIEKAKESFTNIFGRRVRAGQYISHDTFVASWAFGLAYHFGKSDGFKEGYDEKEKEIIESYMSRKDAASAMQDDSPRMMAIGQNGNNGEHYE